MLSPITPPTEGRITLWGRTAALLEVGTGFHPELTGRENVFVNGAILGMRRREIEQRFDEIVEFSGVERFIDTPVKRYSSGMYVRLAFAVAAHLEPEILLVDEVLAVGDAEFQRKCLGKMHEAVEHGRTVLFVSHNMLAVQRLCSRAYVIDKGGIIAEGTPAQAVTEYLSLAGAEQSGGVAVIPEDAPRLVEVTEEAMIRRLAMTDNEGRQISSVHLGQPFRVSLLCDARRNIGDAVVEVGISTPDGQRVASMLNTDRPGGSIDLAQGLNEIEVEVAITLLPGEYTLDVGLHHLNGLSTDYLVSVFRFTALNVPFGSEEAWPFGGVRGYVRPTARWSEARPVSESQAEIAAAGVTSRQPGD